MHNHHSTPVAYLGPSGTYSDEVVTRCLQRDGKDKIPCPTLEDICRGIAEHRWDTGLLPVENSIEGPVGQTMDLLIDYKEIKICGEVLLPVQHCLLAPAGVNAGQIELVLSHPQALGQCRRYLERNLPRVPARETASTAHAAREVAAKGYPWGALASVAAARTYGLQILDRGINEGTENVTRFFIAGREEAGPRENNKTTIIFTIKDRPGALYSILGEFAGEGINLTRIESRPSRNRLGEYVFFIDFSGHRFEPRVNEMLGRVRDKCITFRAAGSYPSAPGRCRDSGEPGNNLQLEGRG